MAGRINTTLEATAVAFALAASPLDSCAIVASCDNSASVCTILCLDSFLRYLPSSEQPPSS